MNSSIVTVFPIVGGWYIQCKHHFKAWKKNIEEIYIHTNMNIYLYTHRYIFICIYIYTEEQKNTQENVI